MEEAKQILKSYLEYPEMDNIELMKKAIETVLSELFKLQARSDRLKVEIEKKDKVINEMAECIGQDIRCVRPEIECNKMTHDCRECVKQYYFNKVEREGK